MRPLAADAFDRAARSHDQGRAMLAPDVRGFHGAANERWWRAEARAAGADEAMLAAAIERMTLDRCAPLAAQLRWLEEVGFAAAGAAYVNRRFAVMVARKASA